VCTPVAAPAQAAPAAKSRLGQADQGARFPPGRSRGGWGCHLLVLEPFLQGLNGQAFGA
jgi:hypothetical protein